MTILILQAIAFPSGCQIDPCEKISLQVWMSGGTRIGYCYYGACALANSVRIVDLKISKMPLILSNFLGAALHLGCCVGGCNPEGR